MESLIGLIFFIKVLANDTCHLLVPGDSISREIIGNFGEDTLFDNFQSLLLRIDQDFKKEGYPFYSIQQISSDFCPWWLLKSGHLLGDSVLIGDHSFSHRELPEAIHLEIFERKIRHILKKKQNEGYPFSRISPEIQYYSDAKPVIRLELDDGPLIIVDSIIVKSENPPKLYLIQRYSGLKIPFIYSLKKIEESIRNLENSGIVESTAPASVLFSNQGSTLYLYLDKKQRVFADVLVGINSDNQNRTILTGEVNLAFSNVFSYAENIALVWRAPGLQQQLLDLNLEFPFLFRTPLGWSGQIRLFRQDSSFATFSGQAAATYFFSPALTAGLGFLRESSSAPGTFQSGIASFTSDYSFFKIHFRGLVGTGIYRKGVAGSAYLNVGQLRENENELNRLKLEVTIESEQRIHSNHKIFNHLSVKHIEGNNILLNESFRTGGAGSIRGFNELLFFASTALTGISEYRFFLDPNAFFKVFYDGAWQRFPQGESGYFQGFGSGLALPLGSGLFHLDVAVGKFPGIPINVRDTRLHVGLSAGF